MPERFESQMFYGLRSDGDAVITDIQLVDCQFQNCWLSASGDWRRRPRIERAEFVGCRGLSSNLDGAIFRDVSVEGWSGHNLTILWGALFDRVTLSGALGALKINPMYAPEGWCQDIQDGFDADRTAFYQGVDWALDIRRARFTSFDYRGVPASLIRRDPTTQPLFLRSTVSQFDWETEAKAMQWDLGAMISQWMSAAAQEDDLVFAVPLAAKKPKRDQMLADIERLRGIGFAEPA